MKKQWFLLAFLIHIACFAAEKNSVIVTENSVETLSWMHRLIAEAEQSIEISSYAVGGEVFTSICDSIEKRLKEVEKLKVFLLVSPLLLEEKDNQMIGALEKRYPGRFNLQRAAPHFSPLPDYCTNENHIKVFLIDEKYFIVGGTNLHDMCCTPGDVKNLFGKTFLAEGTRDMDVIGKGSAAILLRKMFYELFAFWKKHDSTGSFEWTDLDSEYYALSTVRENVVLEKSFEWINVGPIGVVLGNPCEYPNAITAKYEELVGKAAKEIFIANFYFNPASTLLRKLEEAGKRNLQLKLITNGQWEESPFYAFLIGWANRINYLSIFNAYCMAGIFEYHVPGILYHKKVMVVDCNKTLIGSYNINTKSDYGDFELAIIIDSGKVAKKILKVLEKDKKLCIDVTPGQAREWASDPLISYRAALQKLFQGFL